MGSGDQEATWECLVNQVLRERKVTQEYLVGRGRMDFLGLPVTEEPQGMLAPQEGLGLEEMMASRALARALSKVTKVVQVCQEQTDLMEDEVTRATKDYPAWLDNPAERGPRVTWVIRV
jgi:hypothetical protein